MPEKVNTETGEVKEEKWEIIESNGNVPALESVTRGEIDIQIATAKKYPRDIAKFLDKLVSYATIDEETADSCIYSVPRAGKFITGESVRLAEIAVSTYGNIRAAARVLDINPTHIVAQGVCHDLEGNISFSVEVRRRIIDKNGRRFSDDMIQQNCQAACSIAYRNAVYKVIPKAFVKKAYNAARAIVAGDAKTLESKIEKTMTAFQKMGISADRVLKRIERASVKDLTAEDVANLVGVGTAIRDGETTIEEAFPVTKPEEKPKPEENGKRTEALAGKVKGKAKISKEKAEEIKKVALAIMSEDVLKMFLHDEYGVEKAEDMNGEQAEAFLARMKGKGE